MESLSNVPSVGSYDSVISTNSGFSDDSMEHLSAEERACLMYLEETIEALEVQEDSGLSNDEPDVWSTAEKNDDISNSTGEIGSSVAAESASTTTTTSDDKTECHDLNESSEPQSTPASPVNMNVLKTGDESSTPAPESAAVCISQPSVNPVEGLGLASDGDCDPESVTSTGLCLGPCTGASEMDLGIIPPPSDFMDEPDTAPQPERETFALPPAALSARPEATTDTEQPCPDVSEEKTPMSSSVTEDPFNKLLLPEKEAPPGVPEPRSPPVVAPKPKKIPSNIILNSQKTAGAGSDANSGHSGTTGSDWVMLDPQRVRMEALRKLGLLKSNEETSSPTLSPKLSSKTRKSWTAPSPPISPAAPHTPPTTPSSDIDVYHPPLASVPLQSVWTAAAPPSATSPAPPLQDLDILPAPVAFSDPTEPPPSDNELPADKRMTEASANSPLPSTPALVKQPTPPKAPGFKSATLERSDPGLSRSITHQNSAEADQGVGSDRSLRELRNSRPRPASLGSGKELLHAGDEDLQAGRATGQQPDSHRPGLAAFQHSRGSAKLPRSQGISVLICPQAENGENRREALKKLGLIRD